jgi:cyanate permease
VTYQVCFAIRIPMQTSWRQIWLTWLIGVLAAAEFGKLAPLIPILQDVYGLSLSAAAALSSLVELGGATMGLLGAVVVAHAGMRRTLLFGIGLLVTGSVCEAMLGLPGLWAGRVAESAGYLLVVVAAPSHMARSALETDRGLALGLWSTFVPVGLALGAGISGGLVTPFGLQATLLTWAVLGVIVLGAALMSLDGGAPDRANRAFRFQFPNVSVWLMCAGFGCYTMMFVGILSLLPVYLTQRFAMSVATAGVITAVASVGTIIGSAAAAWALRHARSRGRVEGVFLIGIVVPMGLIIWVFSERHFPGTGPHVTAPVIFLIMAVSGIVPTLTFAKLPVLDRRGWRENPAAINGVLAHFGAFGSLIGPPLLGGLATLSGWPVVAMATVLLSALTIGLSWLAIYRRPLKRQYFR